MTSYGWPWLGALLITALGFFILDKKVPVRARHRNLARLGAAMLASGIGLIPPTYHQYTHRPLEIASVALIVAGLALYVFSVREVRE